MNRDEIRKLYKEVKELYAGFDFPNEFWFEQGFIRGANMGIEQIRKILQDMIDYRLNQPRAEIFSEYQIHGTTLGSVCSRNKCTGVIREYQLKPGWVHCTKCDWEEEL